MSKSVKKGPFVDEKLLARIVEHEREERKKSAEDMVKGLLQYFPKSVGHTIART